MTSRSERFQRSITKKIEKTQAELVRSQDTIRDTQNRVRILTKQLDALLAFAAAGVSTPTVQTPHESVVSDTESVPKQSMIERLRAKVAAANADSAPNG